VKYTLEDFQSRAVDGLLSRISKARRDFAEDGERTAVGLTAPTGAGKTVIASAVLEGLYFGTPTREPDPSLTVLWLTDDKSLNAQTISKIVQASGRLDEMRMRFLGDTDEPTLEPGFIYFAHIQQLQRKSTLHAVRDGVRSDFRTHGAWDMIANTINKRGRDFVVIWDEAHRGTGTTATERNTIASTIVNGGLTNIGTHQPPAPVVLGISATPERFHAAMSASGRTLRNYEVSPGEVRESGLLKDRILIKHVAEDQSAQNTMLALAVEDLKAADESWQQHHESTGDRLVKPLLIVQVEAGVSQARLGEILATLESAWSELSDMAVGHAFGDPHGPLHVGDRTVRYIAPEAISGDDRARAVLFKNALTTGWDCPRAEVLVSYQGKDSYTEIAQLIGRLVRTPLASRVDTADDRLNEVAAYLPGYKTEHVAAVVKALTEDETVKVDIVIAPVTSTRSPSVPSQVFDLLDTLPSYTRPKTTFPTRTAQLMRLAAALNEHGLVPKASEKARQWIVDQMRALDGAHKDEIDAKVADNLSLTLGVLNVGLGSEVTSSLATADVETSERDLDGYYARAKRTLPDGSAAWYYNDLCDNQHLDDIAAMVRVAAMASLGLKDKIEKQAEAQIAAWRDQHAGTVARKPRDVRELIEPLWFLGNTTMLPTTVHAPEKVSAATEKVHGDSTVPVDTYPEHLFTIPPGRPNAGLFPVVTTGWEREVLTAELGIESLLGWYRNPSSGKHALAIPYEYGDEKTRLLHPDFLFFHQDGDQIVMDIVDPHRHDTADAAPKWAALANYADDHPEHLRRVLAVIRDPDGQLRALDLTATGIAKKVASANDKAKMEALFASEGTNY
jgi:type III restriction enzyme